MNLALDIGTTAVWTARSSSSLRTRTPQRTAATTPWLGLTYTDLHVIVIQRIFEPSFLELNGIL